MKKLILLLIIPLFLTGCFDYHELNTRAIVSGMAVDYEEGEFLVTLEILNSKKSDSEKESTDKSYYAEGSGKTLSEAIQECNLKVSKDAYYSHLKVVVLSEQIAKEKMESILDYLLRNPNIRNIFIPVMAAENDASEIIKTISTANPVSSEAIQSLIETNKQSNNIALNIDFETFADAMLDKRKDAALNIIKKEGEELSLAGIAAFHGYKLATTLNVKESSTFNVLNNTSENHTLSTYCNKEEEKRININLYHNKKTKIEYEDNKLKVKSDLLAVIVEDECNYDFRDPNVYPEIEKLFDSVIKEEFKQLMEKLQKNQADILKINDSYYKSKRKDLANWYELNVELETNLDVNKNGLIFKVTHDQ